MAEAWLHPWVRPSTGELVLHVRADECPGPLEPGRVMSGRLWGSPRLERGELRFAYRGLGDQVQLFAEQFLAGRVRLREASPLVAHWMKQSIRCVGEQEDRRLRRRDLLVRVRRDPATLFAIWSPVHSHGRGTCDGDRSDIEFSLAAEALELPPWASRDFDQEGGIGSGYTQPVVLLDAGRTLVELADWATKRSLET